MQRSNLSVIAGILTVLSAIIMVYYGLGFIAAYFGSIAYYNTRIFEPALYIGVWNSCAFAFTLVGGYFLLKRRHIQLSIIGIVLALVSGFVPLIVFAVIHGYASNGLEVGAPLMIISAIALVLALLGLKSRNQVTLNE